MVNISWLSGTWIIRSGGSLIKRRFQFENDEQIIFRIDEKCESKHNTNIVKEIIIDRKYRNGAIIFLFHRFDLCFKRLTLNNNKREIFTSIIFIILIYLCIFNRIGKLTRIDKHKMFREKERKRER